MSGKDRAGDGPDTIPDAPRRESATAGAGRGTILTEARAVGPLRAVAVVERLLPELAAALRASVTVRG